MISLTATHSSQWAGLIAASGTNDSDRRTLRDLLGADAPILMLEPGEVPQTVIRELIARRIPNVLAIADPDNAGQITPVLSLAAALSSFRRLVVLHDGQDNTLDDLISRGVLLLRDCPEVRAALANLITPPSASHTSAPLAARSLPATSGHVA